MVDALPKQFGSAATAVKHGGGTVQRNHGQRENEGRHRFGEVTEGNGADHEESRARQGQQQAEQVAASVETFSGVHESCSAISVPDAASTA